MCRQLGIYRYTEFTTDTQKVSSRGFPVQSKDNNYMSPIVKVLQTLFTFHFSSVRKNQDFRILLTLFDVLLECLPHLRVSHGP